MFHEGDIKQRSLADAVHAAGTALPKDPIPPSERWRVAPNRKARRKMVKQHKAKVARHAKSGH